MTHELQEKIQLYGINQVILCQTQVDITPTGTYKTFIDPFTDDAGNTINDIVTWQHSRNQQRNFDTLQQVLNLRTQCMLLTPVTSKLTNKIKIWEFTFGITHEFYLDTSVPLGGLLSDCHQVPICTGLDETKEVNPGMFTSQGSDPNIWFSIISDKYI
jgi:hypothetical protein